MSLVAVILLRDLAMGSTPSLLELHVRCERETFINFLEEKNHFFFLKKKFRKMREGRSFSVHTHHVWSWSWKGYSVVHNAGNNISEWGSLANNSSFGTTKNVHCNYNGGEAAAKRVGPAWFPTFA